MELNQFLFAIKKNATLIFVLTLFFGLAGAFFYHFYPQKYFATGSFYISRKTEEAQKLYFAYDGYYSQQAAISYTNSVAGIFESVDIKSEALKTLGLQINERNLRLMSHDIKVKKAAPQIVNLAVEAKTPTQVEKLYTSVSSSALNSANKLNLQTDPNLVIISVLDKPVVREGFRNVYVDVGVGLSIGLLLGLFISSLKIYENA